jgi:hypothetical protein
MRALQAFRPQSLLRARRQSTEYVLLNGIEAMDPEQLTCVETLRLVPLMIEDESLIDDTSDFGSTLDTFARNSFF